LSFTFYQFQKNRADTLEWKQRELRAGRQSKLLDSLKWFEGGIQNRAVGLAVIEGHWLDQPELRPTWASVLVSQAVYIISKPEARLPDHEVRNLDRILSLLELCRKDLSEAQLGLDFLAPVNDALAALPTRITEPKEGKPLKPLERKQFIEQVLAVVRAHEDLVRIPQWPTNET
jgi:hypothetical protein